jgi:hypothetical protein
MAKNLEAAFSIIFDTFSFLCYLSFLKLDLKTGGQMHAPVILGVSNAPSLSSAPFSASML